MDSKVGLVRIQQKDDDANDDDEIVMHNLNGDNGGKAD